MSNEQKGQAKQVQGLHLNNKFFFVLLTTISILLVGISFFLSAVNHADISHLTYEPFTLLLAAAFVTLITGSLMAFLWLKGNQQSLREMQKRLSGMEGKERENLEILSKVFHDLRSPLTAMVAYASLISDPVFRHDEEFLDKSYEVIVKQGKQLGQYLEDAMLAISLDSQQTVMESTTFPFHPFLEQIVEEIGQKTNRKISYENRAGFAPVYGDPFLLREAVSRFLMYMINYCPPDSLILSRLKMKQEAGTLEFIIQAPPGENLEAEIDALSLPLTRFLLTHSPVHSKIGLALYITNQILASHHGNISLPDPVKDEVRWIGFNLPLTNVER